MITPNETIPCSTGKFIVLAKIVEKKDVFYLCDYKSDVNPVYDRQMKVRENDLLFLKKRI